MATGWRSSQGTSSCPPTPLGSHALLASRGQYALGALLAEEWEVVQFVTVEIAATGERYVPDLAVLPTSVLTGKEWRFSSEDVPLALEITSPSNADTDRVKRPRGYARGHVPSYLLVDSDDGYWTLFSEPENGLYRTQTRATGGAELHLPGPFTGPLPTPETASRR